MGLFFFSRTSVDFNQKLQSQTKLDENPFAALGVSKTNGQPNSMMDDMFQTFGLSEHISDGSDKVEAVNRGTAANSSKPDKTSSSTSQAFGPAAKYKQQAKVSLSMEEKQRIQKEQEFQQRVKNQKPIAPVGKTRQEPKPQVKDLSSMLMESSPSTKPNYSSAGTNSAMGVGLNQAASSFGNNSSMGGQTWGMTTPMGGVSAMQTSQSTLSGAGRPGTGFGADQSTSKQKPNMAALDSLLGPSQSQNSKQKLNQMTPKPAGGTQTKHGRFR